MNDNIDSLDVVETTPVMDNNIGVEDSSIHEELKPDLGLPSPTELANNPNPVTNKKGKKKSPLGIIVVLIILILIVVGYAFYTFYLKSAKNIYNAILNPVNNATEVEKRIEANIEVALDGTLSEQEEETALPKSVGFGYNLLVDKNYNIDMSLAYLEDKKEILKANAFLYNHNLFFYLYEIYDKYLIYTDEKINEEINRFYEDIINNMNSNSMEEYYKKIKYTKKLGNFGYGFGYDNIAIVNDPIKLESHIYTDALLGKIVGIKVIYDSQTILNGSLKNKVNFHFDYNGFILDINETQSNQYSLSASQDDEILFTGSVERNSNTYKINISYSDEENLNINIVQNDTGFSIEGDVSTPFGKTAYHVSESNTSEEVKVDEANAVNVYDLTDEDAKKIQESLLEKIKSSVLGNLIDSYFGIFSNFEEDDVISSAELVIEAAQKAVEDESKSICFSLPWLKENGYYDSNNELESGSIYYNSTSNKYTIWYSNGVEAIKELTESELYEIGEEKIIESDHASDVCNYMTSNIRK